MKISKENLKVSFYLKKNVSRNGLCPVMGRITIGKEMAQFSCKLEADPKLWDMKRSTFKILFYLNTSKRKRSGMCPVMGRITADGSIAQFSLQEEVHPDFWDSKKGRVNGKSRKQIELNRKIEKTEQSIRDIAEQSKNELTGNNIH